MLKTASGEFKALGTTIIIEVPEAFFDEAFGLLETEALRLEKKFSRFEKNSALSRVNRELNKWHKVDAEFYDLLKKAEALMLLTDGKLDLGIHDLLCYWGYDENYDLKSSAEFRTFEKLNLELKPKAVRINVPLDFGSFGKGYFLDQCVEILKNLGLKNYLVNAGGDLVTQSSTSENIQTIFLEDPRVRDRVIGESQWARGFMCASSPSKRSWGEFHHLIDVKNQKPAGAMSAVFVQSEETGLVTDALSTAFFVMGFETGVTTWKKLNADYPSLQVMLISASGTIWRSPQFKGELYTT